MGQGGAFGQELTQSLMLLASGPVTALPLILFSYGARRLTMSTVGIVQYINPTLQFLVAVLIFSEPFGAVHLIAFALIWTALAVYSSSAYTQDRARRRAVMVSEAEVVVSTNPSSDASAKP
jgi:chloramphenicol-sensitive protein RarD